MILTDYAKNHFFAPKLADLTTCGAPALDLNTSEVDDWLRNFAWNTVLRFRIVDPQRQLLFTMLRKIHGAVLEYWAGRQALTQYVEGQRPNTINHYFRALLRFENCLALTYQAWMLARRVVPGAPSLFSQGDGSDLERLNRLYNVSKHAEKFIARGEYAPDSTLALWITNDALETTDTQVPFSELQDMLTVLGRIADRIVNPDSEPLTNNA